MISSENLKKNKIKIRIGIREKIETCLTSQVNVIEQSDGNTGEHNHVFRRVLKGLPTAGRVLQHTGFQITPQLLVVTQNAGKAVRMK